MKEKRTRLLTLLLAADLVLMAALAAYVFSGRQTARETERSAVKYTLCIGLNDKDALTQRVPTEEAERLIRRSVHKYADGARYFSASGRWKDAEGRLTDENTVVCTVNGADEAAIHAICDELLAELNQECILIERSEVECEYYAGVSGTEKENGNGAF